jgi:hypothetical protein
MTIAEIKLDCDYVKTINLKPSVVAPVGYVTNLDAFGIKADQIVKSKFFTPFEGDPKYTPAAPQGEGADKMLECVGLLSYFHWEGGKLDPLEFGFYTAAANQATFTGLTVPTVNDLSFWVCEYDDTSTPPKWYERCYPLGYKDTKKVVGLVAQDNSNKVKVTVGEPEALKGDSNVKYVHVKFEVIPDRENPCSFHFAFNASNSNDVRSWGFIEGKKA